MWWVKWECIISFVFDILFSELNVDYTDKKF